MANRMPSRKKGLKEDIGSVRQSRLILPHTKRDWKLTKLRATLILSVHPTTASYTKLFPAAAATYFSFYNTKPSVHSTTESAEQSRRASNRERVTTRHRQTYLNVHRTTGYQPAPSCHPQVINTTPHCGTSQNQPKAQCWQFS